MVIIHKLRKKSRVKRNNLKRTLKMSVVIIIIKHLEINDTLALNKPLGIGIPLNKPNLNQSIAIELNT